jgi:hypothetical protein
MIRFSFNVYPARGHSAGAGGNGNGYGGSGDASTIRVEEHEPPSRFKDERSAFIDACLAKRRLLQSPNAEDSQVPGEYSEERQHKKKAA